MNPFFLDLSKRKKRNVLFDLLAGKSTEGIISKKELNALNKVIEGPPSNTAPAKIKIQPAKTKKLIRLCSNVGVNNLIELFTIWEETKN